MKKILFSIAALILFISIIFIGLAAIDYGMKYTRVKSFINNEPPNELCYYYLSDGYQQTYFFTDSNMIQKFHDTIINKPAVRNSDLPDNDKIILNIEYGQKGNDIKVDTDGSVYIFRDVAGIRNKSILHWLWWKIDAPDKTYFIYKTQPDKNLIELAKNIKSDIETGITKKTNKK